MPSTDSISLFLAQTGGSAPLSPEQALGAAAPATGTVAPGTAPATAPAGGGGLGGLGLMLPIILVVGMMMIMTTLSGRKDKKKRQTLMDSLGKGDKVLTIGGQIGYIDRISDTEIVLKIDENSNAKSRFTKAAIQQVLESASKGSSIAETETNGAIEVKTKGEKVLAAR